MLSMHVHTDNENYIIPSRCVGKLQHPHMPPSKVSFCAKSVQHMLSKPVCGRINQALSEGYTKSPHYLSSHEP
jgi:hypothetical protein